MASVAASPLFNMATYLRYGALAAGLLYGAVHHKSLQRLVARREAAEHSRIERELIEEGKTVFQAQQDREMAKRAAPISVDPDSYRYSAERHVEWGLQQIEGSSAAPASAASAPAKKGH